MNKTEIIKEFSEIENCNIILSNKIINTKLKKIINNEYKNKDKIDLTNVIISKKFYKELLNDKLILKDTEFKNDIIINNNIFKIKSIESFYKDNIDILEFETKIGLIKIDKEWFDTFICFDLFLKDDSKIIENLSSFQSLIPSSEDIFKWTFFTKPCDIKIVYLGQDPHSNRNESVGVAFATNTNLDYIPKSLQVLYNKLCYQIPEIKNTPTEKWFKNGNFLQYSKHILFLNAGLTVSKVPEYQSHVKYWKNAFTEQILIGLYMLNPKLKLYCLGKESQKCVKKINKQLTEEQINRQVFDQHPASRSFNNTYLQDPIIFEEEFFINNSSISL